MSKKTETATKSTDKLLYTLKVIAHTGFSYKTTEEKRHVKYGEKFPVTESMLTKEFGLLVKHLLKLKIVKMEG